jgi:hypothetical protein
MIEPISRFAIVYQLNKFAYEQLRSLVNVSLSEMYGMTIDGNISRAHYFRMNSMIQRQHYDRE